MRVRTPCNSLSSIGGFTLLEVMVSLVLGALIVGAVMGVISSSLQYTQRVRERSRIQPYLEAAAQEILANPESLEPGSITLGDKKDPITVNVAVARVEGLNRASTFGTPDKLRNLYRVLLSCQGRVLEFSILIPKSEL